MFSIYYMFHAIVICSSSYLICYISPNGCNLSLQYYGPRAWYYMDEISQS